MPARREFAVSWLSEEPASASRRVLDNGPVTSESDPDHVLGDEPAGRGSQRQSSNTSRRYVTLLFVVATSLLGVDVVTKVLAVSGLEHRGPVRILGGAVYLVLHRNPGAAFSLATGLTWVLALLALGVVVAIVWLARRLRSTGWAVGLGLILGGALGNLVDRFFRAPAPLHGHVVDFISLFSPNSWWPVFNFADSGIVCGGVLVVAMSLLGRDYDGKRHDRKSDADTGGSGG